MNRAATTIIGLGCLLAALAGVGGCKQTGVSLVVGEQMLLPEITDAGDNLAIRLYEDVKGARVWSAKNSIVRTEYTCVTTNNYFGLVSTQGEMTLKVDVEPCETDESEDAK